MLTDKIVTDEIMEKNKKDLCKTDELKKHLTVDKSLNSKEDLSTFGGKTRLLIVGTITPSEGKFYYSNPKAKANTLDRLFYYFKDDGKEVLQYYGCKSLSELREKLTNENTSKIKDFFKEKGVAFLDVIKEVLRPINSSSDKEFVRLTLDYDNFKKVFDEIKRRKEDNKLLIIANSNDAQEWFGEIVKKLTGKEIFNSLDFEYIKLSQLRKKDLNSKREKVLKDHKI